MIIDEINIYKWLEDRSERIEVKGSEIWFYHRPKVTSVLVRKEPDDETVESSGLSYFYDSYTAGSIGDSDIMITSSRKGGCDLSAGYKIPDFREALEYANSYDAHLIDSDKVIFIQAGWQFLYYFRENQLYCFDRDFKTTSSDEGVLNVLEEWWAMVLAEG